MKRSFGYTFKKVGMANNYARPHGCAEFKLSGFAGYCPIGGSKSRAGTSILSLEPGGVQYK